jgi:hypothetical protein
MNSKDFYALARFPSMTWAGAGETPVAAVEKVRSMVADGFGLSTNRPIPDVTIQVAIFDGREIAEVIPNGDGVPVNRQTGAILPFVRMVTVPAAIPFTETQYLKGAN